jgi:hypothetical protein
MYKKFKQMTPGQLKARYVQTVIAFTVINADLIYLWTTANARYNSPLEAASVAQAVIVTLVISTIAVRRRMTLLPLWAIIIHIVNAVILIVTDFSITYWNLSGSANGCMDVQLNKIDSIYFTLTTLSTVGYGDIRPVSGTCRVIVSGQMIVGLILVVVILALLVVRISEAGKMPEEQIIGHIAKMDAGTIRALENNNKIIQGTLQVLEDQVGLLQKLVENTAKEDAPATVEEINIESNVPTDEQTIAGEPEPGG